MDLMAIRAIEPEWFMIDIGTFRPSKLHLSPVWFTTNHIYYGSPWLLKIYFAR
jgi:hypothetical protein